MTAGTLIDFLSGALTFAFVLAAVYFVRFWRRTADRLFLHFAAAFALFAANQLAASIMGLMDERRRYIYVLRVLGYLVILFAIVDKNAFRRERTGSAPDARGRGDDS